MPEPQAVATKQDIQMVLDAMGQIVRNSETRLEQIIDKRFDEVETRLGVLVEEAEERFLRTGYDKLSLHDDKLTHHDERLTRVEQAVGV